MTASPNRVIPNFEFFDLKPDGAQLLADVLTGFSAPAKSLPAKYFYDARGAELFEQICELAEYYPTRTEVAIMRAHVREMAAVIDQPSCIIEFGSGSGRKTRMLLDAGMPKAYMPIDISREQLLQAGAEIARNYPQIEVRAVCADYTAPLELPTHGLAGLAKVVYFPGSTIGNFTPDEATEFLARNRNLVGATGGLLIGVDLKKDKAVLDAAYDDAAGVTAEFNLNLLSRIERELAATLDRSAFEHLAFYNESLGRIEMHLRATRDNDIIIDGKAFNFRRGETIHTENSYKYHLEEFAALGESAGWRHIAAWTDPGRLFSVHYFRAS